MHPVALLVPVLLSQIASGPEHVLAQTAPLSGGNPLVPLELQWQPDPDQGSNFLWVKKTLAHKQVQQTKFIGGRWQQDTVPVITANFSIQATLNGVPGSALAFPDKQGLTNVVSLAIIQRGANANAKALEVVAVRQDGERFTLWKSGDRISLLGPVGWGIDAKGRFCSRVKLQNRPFKGQIQDTPLF